MTTSSERDALPIKIEGLTRSAFLLRAGLAASAVYGSAAVAPFIGEALAQAGGESDNEILRLALTLELLEANFYERALKLPLSTESRQLASLLGEHEREHAKRLLAAIEQEGGATADERNLTFNFPALRDERSFLRTAVSLEETGVGAYNGAGPMLKSPDLLALAGSIAQIEGRHVGAVRNAAGESPSPHAFDRGISAQQAVAAAAPYLGRL
jgi:rubrerythrin